MISIISLFIIGFIAQLFDGTVGMGYGSLSSSLLLAFGLSPTLLSASIHTAELFTSLASGTSHLGFGNVDKKILLMLIFPGMIGGIFGVTFLIYITDKIGDRIKIPISLVLLIFGFMILWRFALKQKGSRKKKNKHNMGFGFLGFIAGFIDAIGGGGWGPVTGSGLIIRKDIEPRKIVGSINLAEFFVTLAITLTFLYYLGEKIFIGELFVPLIIGGVIASPFSAYLCEKLPARVLGIVIGIVIILLNIRTLMIA